MDSPTKANVLKFVDFQIAKGLVNVNTGNASTSRVSYVTVIADNTPPTLASASAAGNTNGFNVTFSENVDPVTATTKANYVVNNGIVVDRVEMR